MISNIEIKRHSLAHILMQALERLYGATPGVGPVIENGFYHDFKAKKQITTDNFGKIEKEMKKIIAENLEIKQKKMSIKDSIEFLNEKNYLHTKELAKDLKKAGETELSFYTQGEFTNMCQGSHINNTNGINPESFKLTKVSGVYWKGDEKNEIMQRIYGIAFDRKHELEKHLVFLKEAKKRDHRKLGKELGLFTFSNFVGKGLPLWTEKGATIRRELENFIIKEEIKRGYKHVYTPDIAKIDLYKKSGHYPYYKDSMYAPIEIDDEEFMLRPMTCPHHFELFLSEPKSYRDLPMRIGELAKLYRYEQSGELTGLVRVRSFCLADAHIICANEEQAKEEAAGALDLIEYIAKVFGLKMGEDYWYRLSLGDRADEKKYYKDDKAWNIAENSLREILNKRDAKFIEAESEAAFYGPKIDIQMKNVFDKEDTAFTVQYDFVMPERFNLTYINSDNKKKKTIVIHRSSVGAIERVIAFLIEHYGGSFPLWLSPIQIKIISVGEGHIKYCNNLANEFKKNNIRTEVDDLPETVGNKIRKATLEKVPHILVIGDSEVNSESLMVRDRGSRETREIPKNEFIKEILEKIKNKG